MKTAHSLGIRTNASIMYGHVETIEERLQHLITIREIQDETGGFQAFMLFPFHPAHTKLGEEYHLQRVGAWEDMKMMALSRLILDNIDHVKAFWIMLTMPVAQLALGFGADDLDGTIGEEKIIHAAGARTKTGITRTQLEKIIREAGYEPVDATRSIGQSAAERSRAYETDRTRGRGAAARGRPHRTRARGGQDPPAALRQYDDVHHRPQHQLHECLRQ